MKQQVEFLYDFGSPFSYLAHKVLPDIAARCDTELVYAPVLLGGIFKATKNQSPFEAFSEVRQKTAYLMHDMHRFAKRRGIPFHMNPYFPANTLALMRGATYASGKSWESRYIEAIFDAIWVHGQKLDDASVLTDVLLENELPATDIEDAVQSDEVKLALKDATLRAVGRGVFGTPTMFVRDEMFFGKDSLPDVEAELTQGA